MLSGKHEDAVTYTVIENTAAGPILHKCATAEVALQKWTELYDNFADHSIIDPSGKKVTSDDLQRILRSKSTNDAQRP